MSGQGGGKKAAEMQADEQAVYDATPTVTRCALCPDWLHEGSAAEGRKAALQHRTTVHKQTRKKTRRRVPGAYKFEKPTNGTPEQRHRRSKARQKVYRKLDIELIPEPASEPWHGKIYGYFGKGCRGPKCKAAYQAWYQAKKAKAA